MSRILPHSNEAEMGLLGCILTDPNNSLPAVIEQHGTETDIFYMVQNRTIYEAALHLHESKQNVELISVVMRLKDTGLLDGVGGVAYLNSCIDSVPSSTNVSYYLSIVTEKRTLRRLIDTCASMADKAYCYTGDIGELVDSFEHDALTVRSIKVSQSDRKSSLLRVTAQLEESFNSGGKALGLTSGLRSIDRIKGGLRRGQMITLAARPGMGKSSLAFNIAEHVADTQGAVAFYSYEMSADELNLRAMATEAQVNANHVAMGQATQGEFSALAAAVSRLAKRPLHIIETSGWTVAQVAAHARRMKQRHDIKLLVIDYIQLVRPSKRWHNREAEVSEVSQAIKAMAMELGVPVFCLSQLNREIERDGNRRPRLSDLRESGSIEQDSDAVLFIHCHDANAIGSDDLPVTITVAKNRGGPLGEAKLVFRKPVTQFVESDPGDSACPKWLAGNGGVIPNKQGGGDAEDEKHGPAGEAEALGLPEAVGHVEGEPETGLPGEGGGTEPF